ncbi:MAG TPA: hypothetical protein VEA19_07030, partial [Actinomycetota bacterium]|nr:hypothetical protein [Actinomycetota bacterium]
MRIAIEERAIPAAAVAGFEELGHSLWYLPRSEASEIVRLVREFPPDLVILPLEPRTAEAARMIRRESLGTRILVAGEVGTGELEIQPDWADLVVPRSTDPVLWMLSVLSLQSDAPDEGPAGWRRTLLGVIENTHKAFDAMKRREPGDQMMNELRERLEASFQLLLRVLLDRLEREIPGFAGHSSRVSALARRIASS